MICKIILVLLTTTFIADFGSRLYVYI